MDSTAQFESIVRQHYEGLFRFALSLTGAECDAQDLTQQTFYLWATKGHQLRDFTKVKTWLFTTLHRGFLLLRRRQSRFPQHELTEVPEPLTAVPPTLPPAVESSTVLRALRRVDEVHQSAVALFYLEDCSYKEVAAILDIPVGTVKSRIARGIEQLRRILLAEMPSLVHEFMREPSFGTMTEQSLPQACRQRVRSTGEHFEAAGSNWDFSPTPGDWTLL